MKNDDDFIHLPELYIKLGTLKEHLKKTYNININTMDNSIKDINWTKLEEGLKRGGYDDEKMAMNSCDIIYEYAIKLDKIVKEDTELEEWVKSKLSKAEDMLSDIKHVVANLDTYDHGGELFKQQLLHIAKYSLAIMNELKKGTELMSWMESNLAICADYMDSIYHHLDYKMGNRAKDVAADGTTVKGKSDKEKMAVDFMIALEESDIMASGSHKNQKAVDTIKSIVTMPKSEFSKYIKENPNPKINMIYNEFQDWKQTYKNGGGVSETPIAMMREVTGKAVGTVPVSEEIYTSQVNDFVNYVYEVYEEQGYTKAQVKTAVNKYIKDLGKEFTYGGGDSVDRERVYEYLLNPSLKGIKNPMMRDGGNVGRDAMFRSQEPHEQRYNRKREWKEYKKDNWLANDWFADGGGVGKYYVMDAKSGEVVSKGFDTEEEAKIEKFRMFEETGNFFLTQKMMDNGGGVGFSIYENVYIPSLEKMGSPSTSSGMVTNIFTENGKEMLAIELRNGKGIKIEASKVEKKYANGGGVGNQGLLNKNYLDSIPAEKKAFILKGIAEHYGISVKKVLEEVTSSDAEELADYIMGRGALEVFNAMKSMKMTNGGGVTPTNRQVWENGIVKKKHKWREEDSEAEGIDFYIEYNGVNYLIQTDIERQLFEPNDEAEIFSGMFTNGGGLDNMAAQGMFLDGEFEETVRKVKDYISKYPYVWKSGNKSYVPIEGWQYAASLMGLSARVTEVYAVPEKNGWMAKAEVVNQTGVIVCSGFGFVGRDEEKWAKSTESDLESFSQTKAVSRALRNCISYLIKAAGYSTTPAEEMYGLKGSSKSMNSKKPNLRPIYGVPDIDGQVGPYDMPVQKPIEKASTEERSNISILLQKVWAESKGRGIVLVSPEFMQKIEDNLFDLDATSLSFEVLLADAYDWMIENNVVLRSKIFMKEIAKVVNNLGN
jgi:hypothetical protein